MDYKVNKGNLVNIRIMVAFDDQTGIADVLSVDQYNYLKGLDSGIPDATSVASDAIQEEPRGDVSVTEDGASTATDGVTPIAAEGEDNGLLSQIRFDLSKYHEESASFYPPTYGLENIISSEASVYNPFSGHYYDNSAMKNAKIKYLLREWSLDIPLKHITISGIEQLHRTTVDEIDQIPSAIIVGFLSEYDAQVYTNTRR